MHPIGAPLFTMGMSSIKLQLNKSELVTSVQINLYKAKDSMVVGLSQIKLLGYPMFENMLSAKPDMMLTPVEDLVSRSNMGWLRLLHMCLNNNNENDSSIIDKIDDNTILLCTRLLASPAMIIYDKLIESILIRISRKNKEKSLQIVRYLLRAENSCNQGLYSIPHGILMETLVNILYQICDDLLLYNAKDSSSVNDLLGLFIEWLNEECFKHRKIPSHMIIHCVAAIFYHYSYQTSTSLVDKRFVSNLIEYSIGLSDFFTRQSVNWLLCSVFNKNPDYLELLISQIEKTNSYKLLDTLSYAIQNLECVKILLKSQFFTQLTSKFLSLLDIDVKSSSTSNDIKYYLNVYIVLAQYKSGQFWLGTSSSGCKLWQNLILLLINSNDANNSKLDDLVDLSLWTIKFLKKMLFANPKNQSLFAEFLKILLINHSNSIINSFLHQLLIQILLDEQTLCVNFNRKSTKSNQNSVIKNNISGSSSNSITNCTNSILTHPKFKLGLNFKTVDVSLSKTIQQIIDQIDLQSLSLQIFNHNNNRQQNLLNTHSHLSSKLRVFLKDPVDHKEKLIPNEYTLERVYNIYLKKCEEARIDQQIEQDLNLIVNLNAEDPAEAHYEILLDNQEDDAEEDLIGSSLSAFVNCNGLIVLAERLPTLMPFIREPLLTITDRDRNQDSSGSGGGKSSSLIQQQQQIPKISPDFVDYVIMNESDGPFIEDMYNDMPIQTTTTAGGGALTATNALLNSGSSNHQLKKISMPPHSFIAFGLFLKIPGYAQIILKNRKQAQCILKLLLGETKSKEEEFGLSLSIMPFVSLKELLNVTKSSTNNSSSINLVNFIHETKLLALLLSILSVLSHHPHRQKDPHFEANLIPDMTGGVGSNGAPAANDPSSVGTTTSTVIVSNEDKNNLYWAKGTGFGTGSTMQQWDAEKTLVQQKMEEEHVTCILEIISIYIERCGDGESIDEQIVELIDHSCIINALSSYLRNDSVLDMSRHIPLYKASLKLLQTLILNEKLKSLIEKCNILELIKNIKQFVDSYTSRIKLSEEESDFAELVPLLNETYAQCMHHIKPQSETESESQNDVTDLNREILNEENIERIYCEMVKSLQFDTFPIVSESNGGAVYKANLPYVYESTLNNIQSNLNNSTRAKRLAQETVTLSNSLPVSFSSSVFVRCDEERLDVMKVMITGPIDTPYENGCFEFDVFFPADYPDSPPMINLQTTGNQTVRFNPNLYHDGKVCLSILNTWHGRPEERWNSQTSSFLQVLVSIQSLILVSEPYFNEPGYEKSRGTPAGTASSIEHDANIRQATVKWAMLEMIKKPPACFKEVIFLI
jgi:ubiquitin-protein ligase